MVVMAVVVVVRCKWPAIHGEEGGMIKRRPGGRRFKAVRHGIPCLSCRTMAGVSCVPNHPPPASQYVHLQDLHETEPARI